MATPGLTPVVGATPLTVSDGQAREDRRPGRHHPSRVPHEPRAASEGSPQGEPADSYTHGESDDRDAADRAEQVRRLLERARAEHPPLGEVGPSTPDTRSESDERTGVASSAPANPSPPIGPLVPGNHGTPAASGADLAARYANVSVEPPPHAIDETG